MEGVSCVLLCLGSAKADLLDPDRLLSTYYVPCIMLKTAYMIPVDPRSNPTKSVQFYRKEIGAQR